MNLNNQKAYLLIVISFIIIIALFCGSNISVTLSNYSYTDTINGAKALAFADAGINKAAYEIKNNASLPLSISWEFPDATNIVSITINAARGISDTYNITSQNTFKGSTKTISAQMRKDATLGTVSLFQWQQIN